MHVQCFNRPSDLSTSSKTKHCFLYAGAKRSQVHAIATPVETTPAQPKTSDPQTSKRTFSAPTRSPEPPAQPYTYNRQTLVEPDWTRFPLWRHVTADEWRSVTWQRAHSVKNIAQLRAVFGDLLSENFYQDLARDQKEFATMALLLPPQMINTMVPHCEPSDGLMRSDPVRRYMLPLFSDRDPTWPSHPKASRDLLQEAEMWVTEGLTHRYPTKVRPSPASLN
jgi:lysine 2,3-aminomutase